jgi:hypothetical protein
MADAKKPKPLVKGITPLGIAIFPWLSKPDTKFKAEGEYRLKLKLEGEEATKLKAAIDAAYDQAIALMAAEKDKKVDKIKRADKPYKAEEDKEGNETGALLFTFKQKAQITFKTGPEAGKTKQIKVDILGAGNKPLPKDSPVFGGSKVKVAFEAWPFFTAAVGAGLTLRLNAVKVIELVSSGNRDYGFDEDEGYAPTDSDDDTPSSDGEKSKSDSEDDNPDF